MARTHSSLGDGDLPPELQGILESDDEPQNFGSDEFDPAALLSEPLFDDSQADLNVSKSELMGLAPDSMAASESTSGGSPTMKHHHQQQQAIIQQQQASFQQQQQMPPQQFSGFDQNMSNQMQQGQMHDQQQFNQFDQQQQQQMPSQQNQGMNDVQTQPVNMRVQEVQQQIQQVQQQIQQVHLHSSMDNQSPMQQNAMQQQHKPPAGPQQQNFRGMMSTAGMTRSPPGRSVSQHQHRFQQMQGVMKNVGMGNTRSPPGRSASMPIRRNTMQGAPSLSPGSFMMQQQQQGQQNSMQQMHGSMNGSMSGMNGSMNGSMHNSFSQQQIEMNMNSNMTMMQQQQQAMDASMNSLPSAPMAGGLQGGPVMRQNSLPHNTGDMQGQNGMQMGMPGMGSQGELLQSGSFDPNSVNAQGFNSSGGPQGKQGQVGVNEAMEKLCESMRRSAMSRSLVKQLSGRNLSRQNSGRQITKQHSGRNLSRQNSARLTKQMSGRSLSRANSGRNLVRANSGRALQRSHSGRQLLGGMTEGGDLPVRRMSDTKHRTSRGVFRHKSQSAIIGARGAPRGMLQMDDNNQTNMF